MTEKTLPGIDLPDIAESGDPNKWTKAQWKRWKTGFDRGFWGRPNKGKSAEYQKGYQCGVDSKINSDIYERAFQAGIDGAPPPKIVENKVVDFRLWRLVTTGYSQGKKCKSGA